MARYTPSIVRQAHSDIRRVLDSGRVRLHRMEIDNFLCFRQLDLTLDSKLQVLAGPNNAGKSSAVRLLEAFLTGADSDTLCGLQPRFDWYAKAGGRLLSSIKLWFGDLSAEEETTFATTLRRRDMQFWVALRCGRGGDVTYKASNTDSNDAARAVYEAVVEAFHFVKIPSVRVGGAGDSEELGSLERLLDTLEAVLIRPGGGKRSAVQKRFAEELSRVETVVKEVLDDSAASISQELPFQGGAVAFVLPEQRHALRGMLAAAVIESQDGARVPVSDRGTGFQSALILGVLKYVAHREAGASANVLFAVEEPEAFLHPQTQRAMTQVLKGIAQQAQLVVTTHSPVVVDTFRVTQIARLPLQVDGTELTWRPAPMDHAQEGRLARYCNAGNSELVFANAVILVEGEGDLLLIQHLLGRICGDTGGYYARGVTVIEAGGLTRIAPLVELAQHFGVRSYVVSDRDGLRAADKRQLIKALKARGETPSDPELQKIRTEADKTVTNYRDALKAQASINALLAPYDAYCMCSDLEGLILDSCGLEKTMALLGPFGEAELDHQFLIELSGHPEAYDRLRKRIGSKGWLGDKSTSGKLNPHAPALVFERLLDGQSTPPKELKRLTTWLQAILDDASTSAV